MFACFSDQPNEHRALHCHFQSGYYPQKAQMERDAGDMGGITSK